MDSQTEVPGIVWPPIPGRRAAGLMAMQFQLSQSQWLPFEELKERQFKQLVQVVGHAVEKVPYYQRSLNDFRDLDSSFLLQHSWERIPILSRTDVQKAGKDLHSTHVPKSHGQVRALLTSGSTGQPVQCLGTQITQFFWHSITLRDHYWHERDFAKKLAAIRYTDKSAAPPDGKAYDTWGAPVDWICHSGPSAILTTDSTVCQQADWLRKQSPSYLIAYPSNLKALARLFLDHGWELPDLTHVRSFGEIVEPDVRKVCDQAWGVPVVDCYSSQEVGYVALECPKSAQTYHVQSESAFVEILDNKGKQCEPGEIGRVVVTTLHNAAMPLIRYDLGDYAEVGPPCQCGRGLPTLNQIVGRQRNMVTFPNGEQRWPGLGRGDVLERLPNIQQFQVVQVALDKIDIRLVQAKPFDEADEERVKEHLRQALGYPFEVRVNYVDQIVRSPNGKYEEFLSEL